MLAESRAVMMGDEALERTPLLVPSFSSKGFPDVQSILEYSAEIIDGPALVSAYDLYHRKISGPFEFPSLLFLDSGGYEASKDTELSDLGQWEYEAETWTPEMHDEVLRDWTTNSPTVFISYDHPRARLSVRDQIERALRIPIARVGMREILLKPETEDQRYIQIDSILQNIHGLAEFAVVGVTEKEVGASIAERMLNIAKLRRALTKAGLATPIHVFGSLDTITTPMYFLAGADIFDGLTWLRFAYHEGQTIYKHNFSALKLGLKTRSSMIDVRCWNNNYYYIRDMELEMKRFLVTRDFASFKYHGEVLSKAWQDLQVNLGG